MLRTCAYVFGLEIVLRESTGERHVQCLSSCLVNNGIEGCGQPSCPGTSCHLTQCLSRGPLEPLELKSCRCAADVTKHAVLGKFNEIRPGVYREFMKVRCAEMLACT